MTSLKSWLGQSTTGQGATGLAATLLALLSGTITMPQAIPALVGSLVLIAWPQNTALASAAEDAVKAIEPRIPTALQFSEQTLGPILLAYKTGLTHGAASVTPAVAAVPPTPIPTPAPLIIGS